MLRYEISKKGLNDFRSIISHLEWFGVVDLVDAGYLMRRVRLFSGEKVSCGVRLLAMHALLFKACERRRPFDGKRCICLKSIASCVFVYGVCVYIS